MRIAKDSDNSLDRTLFFNEVVQFGCAPRTRHCLAIPYTSGSKFYLVDGKKRPQGFRRFLVGGWWCACPRVCVCGGVCGVCGGVWWCVCVWVRQPSASFCFVFSDHHFNLGDFD
jgi:hypothetical protein